MDTLTGPPMVGGEMERMVADARVYYGGQEFRVTVPEAESLDNQVWAQRESGKLPQMMGFETSSGKQVKVWVSDSIPLAIEFPAPAGEGTKSRRAVVIA